MGGALSGELRSQREIFKNCSPPRSCGLRDFWTESTGDTVGRSQFNLLWARGRLEDGPRIWEAIKDSA